MDDHAERKPSEIQVKVAAFRQPVTNGPPPDRIEQNTASATVDEAFEESFPARDALGWMIVPSSANSEFNSP